MRDTKGGLVTEQRERLDDAVLMALQTEEGPPAQECHGPQKLKSQETGSVLWPPEGSSPADPF